MPSIDISALGELAARPPEVGTPPRAPAPSHRRTATGAPVESGAASAAHVGSQAFLPPAAAGEDDLAEIGVERSTRAIRIANQFRSAPSASPPTAASLAGPRPVMPHSPPVTPARSSTRSIVLAVALIVAALIGLLAIAGHRS
jgi:hypothetical protein